MTFFDIYCGGEMLRKNGITVVKNGQPVPAVTKILFNTNNLSENYLTLNDELPIMEYFMSFSDYLVFTTSGVHNMVNGLYQYWKFSDLKEWDNDFLIVNDWNGTPDFMKFRYKTDKGYMELSLENRIPFNIALKIINILGYRK